MTTAGRRGGRRNPAVMPLQEPVLAEIVRHGASSDGLRSLAAQLDIQDYVTVAHVLCRDQAFWLPLLPPGDRSGVALVIETRLGSLATRLAPHYGRVIAWHRSRIAAAVTERRVAELGLDNVQVVAGVGLGQLELDRTRPFTLVVVGLGEDAVAARDETGSLGGMVLKEISKTLEYGGLVVAADNNRLSYRRLAAPREWFASAPPFSVAAVRRAVGRLARRSQMYVGRGPLSAALAPRPELVGLGASGSDRFLPRGRRSAWKERLLNSAPVRLLWPSFLTVASGGTAHSLLQEVLAQANVAERLGWGPSQPCAKRLVAGHRETTIAVVGPPANDDADVVVRLPMTAAGLDPWRTNARALRLLATSPLAGLVPSLIAEGVCRDQHFTIETRCRGFEIEQDAPGVHRSMRAACDTLGVLHRATGREQSMTAAAVESALGPSIRELSECCTAATRARLEAVGAALTEAMVGIRVIRGCSHGDFKLGNILFDRSERVTAIFDWDSFAVDGFPVFDFLTLLVYKIAQNRSITLPEAYLEHLLPWRLPTGEAGLAEAEGPLARLVLDVRGFLLLRAAFWFVFLSARSERYHRYHACWEELSLNQPLAALEAAVRTARRLPGAAPGCQ